MGFYLSPKVDFNEIDLSTTVAATATSIAATVFRNSYKGIQGETLFASSVDGLIQMVGEPDDASFIDILSAVGHLKYGNNLYYSIARPANATFGGGVLGTGYNITAGPVVNGSTWTAFAPIHTLTTLGIESINDITEYITSEVTSGSGSASASSSGTIFDANSGLGFFSTAQGIFGNKIRVLVFDAEVYKAAKFINLSTGIYKFPTGVTATADAQSVVTKLYSLKATNNVLANIKGLDISFSTKYEFCVIVQTKGQNDSTWKDTEMFIVSTDESGIDDSGNSTFAETVINEQSQYIRTIMAENIRNEVPLFATLDYKAFTGGGTGTWTTEEEISACIDCFERFANAEEIDVNIFIDSDKPLAVKQYLIELSQTIRRDSFTILDVPKSTVYNKKGTEVTNIVNWRLGIDGLNFNPNSSYAALYANWIEVYDKWAKKYRWIPASGYVSGLFANNDDVADSWWAPAGLNRGILENVRRLAWNPKEGDRDILYKNGINPIVSFAGQGKVIWGQKTLLDKSSAFNRINVRRLFLTLEKAIATVSKYFLFEQNDEITRMLFINMVEPYLRDIKGRRGIYDFKVQCDELINTPEVIDRNEFRANIFIKATRTAEFISLNFINTKTGANFEELVVA